MKIFWMILFILLSIWSIFSFDLEKPFVFLRYSIALIVVYPLRFLYLIAFIITVGFLFYQFYYRQQLDVLVRAYRPTERIFKDGEAAGADVKNIDGTVRYVKILKILNTEMQSGLDYPVILKSFVTKSRQIYNLLPRDFRDKPEFRTSFFVFQNPVQISYVDVPYWNQRIIFFVSDSQFEDLKVSHSYDLNGPPSKKDLMLFAPKIPEEIYDDLIRAYTSMREQNTIYDPHNFSFFRDRNGGRSYLIMPIPLPAEKFNYNNILKQFVGVNPFE